MAVYNARTICFLVLVVGNAGQASVQKSNAAQGFQGGKSFAPQPEHNGPNLNATDQRVSALEQIIEVLLHDNDDKERRLEHLETAIVSACSTFSLGKALYTGTQSTTTSGFTCQRWDTQVPHGHSFKDDHYFTIPGLPQTVSGSANYCRDPASDGFLWCYTTDLLKRWENCSVPVC